MNLFTAVYICPRSRLVPPFRLHGLIYRSWSECAAWSMIKGLYNPLSQDPQALCELPLYSRATLLQ